MELTQFGNQLPISPGTTQIPYQELTFTLAAGAVQDIFQVFNYFRVLSLTPNTLSVQFGENGMTTPFSGQGIGIQSFYTYSRVRLINTGGAPITITIALALGWVNDDRLNISSTVNIQGTVQTKQSAAFVASQVSVDNTADQLVAASATNGVITIAAGVSDLYVGPTSGVTTANGFLIPAGGSFSYALGYLGDVYGIRAGAAQTAYVLRETY